MSYLNADQALSRPRSLYDNLNATASSAAAVPSITSTPLVKLNRDNRQSGISGGGKSHSNNNNNNNNNSDRNNHHRNSSDRSNIGTDDILVCGAGSDFPFSDISFKFDDLLDRTVDSVNNNSINIQRDRANVPLALLTMNNDHNLISEYRPSSNGHDRLPPVASTSGSSNHSSSSFILHPHQHPSYENVKPVISEAKSSFFGLSLEPGCSKEGGGHSGGHGGGGGGGRRNRNTRSEEEENEVLLSTDLPTPAANHAYQNVPHNSIIYRKSLPSELQHHDVMRQCDEVSSCSRRHSDGHDQCPNKSQCSSGNSSDDTMTSSRRNAKYLLPDNSSLSQAVYMSTTVPQNIKGVNIMGRHTPTRNSLRHSRMLVINKCYQGVKQPNPLEIKYPCLAKFLLVVEVIMGLLITCLSLWILLWAPNTRTRDNPYWSGLALTLSGALGLGVMEFRKSPRHKIREHCFTFLRVNTTVLTFVTVFFALAAFVFGALHLYNIIASSTHCAPANIFTVSSACICHFGVHNTTNHQAVPAGPQIFGGNTEVTVGGVEFEYRDLSCNEVTGAWKYILIASTSMNFVGFLTCMGFLSMLLFRRKVKRKPYSSVRSDPI